MIKATDRTLRQLVYDGICRYGWDADLNYIDTSAVTDMEFLFSWCNFNGNISKWDTSNVIYMKQMFYHNHSFNGDISSWDVSKVKDTSFMFFCCDKFNQPLDKWKLNKDVYMTAMFSYSNYNQTIVWDVDIKNLFGRDYDDYLERQKLNLMYSLLY